MYFEKWVGERKKSINKKKQFFFYFFFIKSNSYSSALRIYYIHNFPRSFRTSVCACVCVCVCVCMRVLFALCQQPHEYLKNWYKKNEYVHQFLSPFFCGYKKGYNSFWKNENITLIEKVMQVLCWWIFQ